MSRTAELWDRVRTVPGLGRNLVAAVAIVAIGVGSGAAILSNYAFDAPWQKRFVFSATFDKAPGLNVDSSQEVRIAGVPVGEVVGAEADQGDDATLRISIDPGHQVFENARLEYRTKTPLNVPYLALVPGGPPAALLAENATVPVSQTTRNIQPYEILNELDEHTQESLTSLLNESDTALADAPAQLPGGLRATDATVATLQPVMESLQQRRELIQKLVTSLSRISTAAGRDDQRLTRLVASLQETLSVLGARDRELTDSLGKLPGTTGTLREALASTSDLTTELDPVLESLDQASGELPDTVRRVTDTVRKAGPVVDTARPVVAKARPVVADLRPLVGDARVALDDLKPVTGHLPDATERLAPWMPNLAAFVYQTSSAFSLHDANGGFGRAQLTIDPSNPTAGLGEEAGGTRDGYPEQGDPAPPEPLPADILPDAVTESPAQNEEAPR
ncbi:MULTISPECIES: MlaD family protein [unclassified Pseudonocardia]|uniref:MlaD family protein n=1 Tax=unclassified Pseudonocardia TaxID=2619320 RepID=UPI000306FEC9|nr:MlaD family protein [Pseudonocardia sp. Ae707_Ps1]OLM16736.1 hypothetical protein Ae707Ps1_0994 [Pseudonocardia sp. Ae707_Ps1]